MIADRGLSAASVAIDPGPFRGVLPLPSRAAQSAVPVLNNPLNRGRAVTLTFDEFKYGWTNAINDEKEERRLYDTYHVAAPGVALMQMANANLNPFTEAKVDPKNPERGPLLIIDGEKDHTVPWAIANAAYKRQRRNEAVTEIKQDPEPRPLADDRQRLGRGRADGARLRQAVHLAAPQKAFEADFHSLRRCAMSSARSSSLPSSST